MSKLFSCIFPYSKLSKSSQSEDISNQAFITSDKNSSICELSYHHVDAVNTKVLQKRIQKLEADKEALVEMMIYQHEDFKRRSSVYDKLLELPKTPQKTPKKTKNYYSTVHFQNVIRNSPKQCIDESNIYHSID